MYKLQSQTLGIVRDCKGKSVALAIPENSLVKVVGEESTDGTVDVAWNDQVVNVFAIDLRERGAVVGDATKSAPSAS